MPIFEMAVHDSRFESIRASVGGGDPVWLPRSEIHIMAGSVAAAPRLGERTFGLPRARIDVPEWLARERGLIGGGDGLTGRLL